MSRSNVTSLRLRRSTRLRKVPASYAVPDEDPMSDFQYTGLPTQSRWQEHQQKNTPASHSSTMKARGLDKHQIPSTAVQTRLIRLMTPRKVPSAAPGSLLVRLKYQEVESSDGSDGEYGVKPKKKKLKIAHIYEKISVGNTGGEEQVLRRICNGLGIQFSLFDGWVEDPWLKDPSKVNIPFMPNEVMMEIFGYCRTEALVQCEKSCRRFQSLLKDNTR